MPCNILGGPKMEAFPLLHFSPTPFTDEEANAKSFKKVVKCYTN